jgi:hypothetical protein
MCGVRTFPETGVPKGARCLRRDVANLAVEEEVTQMAYDVEYGLGGGPETNVAAMREGTEAKSVWVNVSGGRPAWYSGD